MRKLPSIASFLSFYYEWTLSNYFSASVYWWDDKIFLLSTCCNIFKIFSKAFVSCWLCFFSPLDTIGKLEDVEWEEFVLQLYSGKIFFPEEWPFLRWMLWACCTMVVILLQPLPEWGWNLFSDPHCENLVRFLKGPSKNCSPREFHSHDSSCTMSSNLSKLSFNCSFYFMASAADLSCHICVDAPVSPQVSGWRFSLWLQFSDESKKSQWFAVCPGFF